MPIHKIFTIFIVTLFFSSSIGAQTMSPNEFLPHTIGEEFTPHHLLVDYMYHVADNNSNVLISEYGRTNQKRPLLHLIISAQKNIDNIEKIRLNNLYRAGIPEGESFPEVDDISIVWLSFSVHGNEAAGSESSMPVIYELVTGSNPKTKHWLENTVVLYDPSINPDGYSRYTHWNRNVAEKAKSPEREDWEHEEPWPGGRVNHYLFDLNRDWAWQTQVESQQRMKVYNKWLPHVHVDFHEMGYNQPYYFAPAAKPYHSYITEWQGEFQNLIGRNHAKYFDKEGWLYFTREVFDLFYPSYGDTYPTFNGAIGMTYEQGGHSRAGRAINMDNGEILTLADRVEHHYTTALSTIETASTHSTQLIQEFKTFFQKPAPGKYQTYVVKGRQKGKLMDLAALLDLQKIEYKIVEKGGSARGFSYQQNKEASFPVDEGDMLIPVDQPKKVLVQVLMDPQATLEDSLTYDITAWALPYAYGLEAYASTQKISGESSSTSSLGPITNFGSEFYAIILEWDDLKAAKIVGNLHEAGISMRRAAKPFSIGDNNFGRNSVIITKADNKSEADNLLKLVSDAGAKQDDITLVNTGFSDSGADLGSGSLTLLEVPKVLVLSGDRISTNSFGQVWYYFEQVADYPLTIVDTENLWNIDMNKYNTLVIADATLRLSDEQLGELSDWVRSGGKLINIGYGNRNFANKDGWALKTFATEEEEAEEKVEDEERQLSDRFHAFDGGDRRRIVNNVPGSIFEVKMDETHPLSYGIGNKYYSLKTSSLNYRPLKGAQNVGIIPENAQTIGFTGSAIKQKLMGGVSFAVERKGRGSVIYMIDNPLYRGFWKEGQLLFSNALFLVD